ncbi:uncharacterized protein M6B38_207390 [Iris pallida]|uniref:YTH domain-containing family protein n=1 Tax=Iris pallida TaxID=29817 RepID=A0AAX6E5E8_IRIPA|nr:uncharacterized protein M6B38_207390 [Iris pallida]
MASEKTTANGVEESLRNLKLDTASKVKNGDTVSGHKDGSTSEATSCISSADATSIVRESEVDRAPSVPERGVYSPANALYGYYYPGFDGSVGEWDNQSFYMPTDGLQIHQAASPADNGSLVYYFPGFQPGYNPQTQYMPGAVIGADGQYWGQQLYYPDPTVSQPLVSPGLFPQSIPYGSELYPAYSWDPYTAYADGIYDKGYGDVTVSTPKSTLDSRSQTLAPKTAPSLRPTTLDKKAPSPAFDSISNPASQIQSLNSATKANTVLPRGFLPMNKLHSYPNQGKNGFLYPTSPSNIKETGRSWVGVEKQKARNRAHGSVDFDMLNEQNRGPRTNGAKNTMVSGPEPVGSLGAEGTSNCITSVTVVKKDEYNLPEFPTKYDNAFFFVIKSYSEDDIHKSIKYNVWASTPNGNKRLEAAFQAAQEKMAEKGSKCPVFLFFSVNASGQFCGVAEMIGHVDFDKSMDFWQQDKWSGYFPVKWHIIKDIPNPQFRHIILENNDNKPVTNSRDTQEVKLPQGTEMLNLFKNFSSKTSILDDFEFYENRQKVMQEKKMKPSTPKLDPLPLKSGEMPKLRSKAI